MSFEYKKINDWEHLYGQPARLVKNNNHIFDQIDNDNYRSLIDIYIDSCWTGWASTMKALIEELRSFDKIERKCVPDAFTIGYKSSYDESLEKDKIVTKVGKSDDYDGGCCVKTFEEAKEFAIKYGKEGNKVYDVYGLIFDIDAIIEDKNTVLVTEMERALKDIYNLYSYEHKDKTRRILFDATIIKL